MQTIIIMKKTKSFGLAFMAAILSLSACNNDVKEIPTQENEIKLTSEIIPTRVTSLDYQSTQIIEGQQVGVTITGGKTEHNNVAWIANKNGLLTNTEEPCYWNDENVTIAAYHPYNSAWTGMSHVFSVSTDQSTESGYLNSDLLWTTVIVSPMNIQVPLLFSHKLAKINITIKSEEISDISDATIYVCGTQISANFNLSTGELSTATNNVADIKAATTTNLAHTGSAIIIPQAIASGTNFIKIEHRGKEYNYQLPKTIEYESGKSYNYQLVIKKKGGDCEGNMNGGGNGWN